MIFLLSISRQTKRFTASCALFLLSSEVRLLSLIVKIATHFWFSFSTRARRPKVFQTKQELDYWILGVVLLLFDLLTTEWAHNNPIWSTSRESPGYSFWGLVKTVHWSRLDWQVASACLLPSYHNVGGGHDLRKLPKQDPVNREGCNSAVANLHFKAKLIFLQ